MANFHFLIEFFFISLHQQKVPPLKWMKLCAIEIPSDIRLFAFSCITLRVLVVFGCAKNLFWFSRSSFHTKNGGKSFTSAEFSFQIDANCCSCPTNCAASLLHFYYKTEMGIFWMSCRVIGVPDSIFFSFSYPRIAIIKISYAYHMMHSLQLLENARMG